MAAPSKTFIIRASIAGGLLILILLSQTNWVKQLFTKKNNTKPPSTETVGQAIQKDTNGNGILDWEERLWGLDPTVLYTNGVPNKEIIEQKKRSLGPADSTDMNETDRLARELFILTTSLGQSGSADLETYKKIGEKLGESVDIEQISNRYSFQDIKPATTTRASLEAYYKAMNNVLASYDETSADIDVVIASLETGDFSRIDELEQTKIKYRDLAHELSKLRVPLGVVGYHLDIINGLYGMSEGFGYLSEIDDNAVKGLTGVAIYKTFVLRYQAATINLSDYLEQYGIL